jgi:hypothetical protein
LPFSGCPALTTSVPIPGRQASGSQVGSLQAGRPALADRPDVPWQGAPPLIPDDRTYIVGRRRLPSNRSVAARPRALPTADEDPERNQLHNPPDYHVTRGGPAATRACGPVVQDLHVARRYRRIGYCVSPTVVQPTAPASHDTAGARPAPGGDSVAYVGYGGRDEAPRARAPGGSGQPAAGHSRSRAICLSCAIRWLRQDLTPGHHVRVGGGATLESTYQCCATSTSMLECRRSSDLLSLFANEDIE